MQRRSLTGIPTLLLIYLAMAQAFAHSYGPAARVTGAPGDNARACTSCHTGTLNSGTGNVKILLAGGPVYIPGVKQRVTVQVSDPLQQRWGFELTARLNSNLENGQAGELVPVDNFTQVVCEDNAPTPCASGVSFIQHTSAGTRSGTRGGATFQFDWNPPATNAGRITLYVAGNAANADANFTGDLIYTSSLELAPATPTAPAVASGNIVSAATNLAGPLAPNSWVTVYGTNLGVTTRSWNESDFTNGGMPVSLDGVSVILNAFGAPRRAYVGFVSPTQVNFLLPSDTNVTTVQVQVRNPAGISTQLPITVQANAPQLFTLDGKYVGKATPGATITLYATGAGATVPPLIPGQTPVVAAGVATLPRVTVGGTNATVTSAGVVPGDPGVYQITVQLPSDLPDGDQPVVIQSGTFSSAPALITIQK